MARPQSVEDAEVMAKLSCVFRDVGYEGASLAMLAEVDRAEEGEPVSPVSQRQTADG